MEIEILLVDDHNLIIEGYKQALLSLTERKFNIHTSENLEKAIGIFELKNINLVILDINFPIHPKSKFISGEDFAGHIRLKFPKTHIVIITMINDSLRMREILMKINPEAFLLKSETSVKELIICIDRVLVGGSFYSPSIQKILNSYLNFRDTIDSTDHLILYQLSLGTKTKHIPEIVCLSLRAVENRKRRLKQILGVEGEDNKELIEQARLKGYL